MEGIPDETATRVLIVSCSGSCCPMVFKTKKNGESIITITDDYNQEANFSLMEYHSIINGNLKQVRIEGKEIFITDVQSNNIKMSLDQFEELKINARGASLRKKTK